MKRILLVMLSLGLVLAFSASAMAVDVKFSGSYYAAGLYLNKVTLRDATTGTSGIAYPADASSSTSTAFYYQRLRVGTDFIVSPGLKLVTRFDALERIWGGTRTGSFGGGICGGTGTATGCDAASAGSRQESENIAFDVAYLEYLSPIGLFQAGYMPSGAWGTVFGNSQLNGKPIAKLGYGIAFGPVTAGLSMEKTVDYSYSYNQTSSKTDRDYEKYSAAGIYKINKDIEAGLAFEYRRVAQHKGYGYNQGWEIYGWQPYYAQTYALNPYAKAKFGPVSVEAEYTWAWGKGVFEGNRDDAGTLVNAWQDIDISNMSAYLNVTADFKKVYVGGTFAYVSGDDPGTTDKIEGGLAKSGKDFNPCLILLNPDRTYWVGSLQGYGYNSLSQVNTITAGGQSGSHYIGFNGTTSLDNDTANFWLFQVKAGVRPVDALDINFSATFANADKKPNGFGNFNSAYTTSVGSAAGNGVVENAYGWEFDLTGTYKITNNLSYMLGAGYLWTGKYFEGEYGPTTKNGLNNNYILTNKLLLTF